MASRNRGEKLIWHERLRTGEDSRAAVRMSDSSILRVDELTVTEILPPEVSSAKPTVDLKQGTGYFFSREKSREINVKTPAANGAIRGTEFIVAVAANGQSSFTMLDGEVDVSNAQGSVVVRSGERADVEPGHKPTKTAVIMAVDLVQWCLYYPGVLDLSDLKLASETRDALRESLAAYNAGDLLGALKTYPRSQVSDLIRGRSLSCRPVSGRRPGRESGTSLARGRAGRARLRSALHLDRRGYLANENRQRAAAHGERLGGRILLPAVEERSRRRAASSPASRER